MARQSKEIRMEAKEDDESQGGKDESSKAGTFGRDT